jgi:PAS domain S-box-containing protein
MFMPSKKAGTSKKKPSRLAPQSNLRRLKICYRRLFESPHAGVLLVDAVSRKITDANPFMTELLGYTREDLLGKELGQIGLIKDEQAAFLELKQKGQIRFEDLSLETKSGGKREVAVVAICYKEDGTQVIQCTIRDITRRKRTERELAEKARLLDLTNDAIIVRGADDKISLWNKGAEKLYGWTSGEVIGKHLHSRLQTEFPKPMEEVIAELHREGHFHGEVVQVARDGRRIPSLCRWVLDSQTGSILTSYTDISERKRADKTLAEKARLLDLANDAIIVRDIGGRILYWNKGAETLYGWSSDEALGKMNHSLLQTESLIPFEQITKELDRDNRWEGEFVQTTRDGRRITLLVRKSLERDSQGNPVTVLETLTDITQRKRTEEALRQREAHLRKLNETLVSVLAAIPDIVFVTGAEGEIDFKNAAAEHFARIVGVNDGLPSPVEIELKQVLATGEYHLPTSFKVVHRFRIDNSERYFLSRIVRMMSAEQRLFGAVVMLQDVTEFRLLDEVKTDLVSTVSHELKTPLTSLRTALILLREQTVGTLNERQTQMVGIACDESERLLRMLNALLDLARFEENTLGLKVEATTAEALIRSSVEQTANAAKEAQISVRVELDPDLPALDMDLERIMHVLTNFLTNAIKYSPPHSTILIQARNHGDGVYFAVVDHGPGVPKEYQSRIFEKFFRVPGTSKKGAGLGLAIARECVRAHRGQIGVRCEDSRGSEFYFILPRRG